MPDLRAPAGTHDVLPPESRRWEDLVARFRARVTGAGYGLVVTPGFEELAVFERLGSGTDVVRKEMYEFEDKGGRRMALRPEGTASIVRAYAQHRPTTPFKAWYVAPHFRYERPQAGRYRQHHQVGVEALGSEDPDLDVEVVALAWGFCLDLGLERVDLLLNSLGDDVCRPGYLETLRAFLEERLALLCDEHQSRALDNPLRVLDCKREGCRDATAEAPILVEFLCDGCDAHFVAVQAGLGALGIPYRVEPRLVRGLDYYTRTTFEMQVVDLDAAQNAVGGGGRYDKLVEAMGGPPTPGIGFGFGIERVLLACDAAGVFRVPPAGVDAWVIDTSGTGAALVVTHMLRDSGLSADRSFGARSMKAQFRAAGRSGARVALVIGEQEAADGTVTVRDLETGDEKVVNRADLIRQLKESLG